MKLFSRRLLTMLLAAAMVFSLSGMTAFAAETDDSETQDTAAEPDALSEAEESAEDVVEPEAAPEEATALDIAAFSADEEDIATIADDADAYEATYDWYLNGTSPYEISSAEDLAGLSDIVNGTADGIEQDSFEGETVTLADTIVMNEATPTCTYSYDEDGITIISNISTDGAKAFTPIGNARYSTEGEADEGYVFLGTFDGNNKEIKNLYVTGGSGYLGLFGVVGGLDDEGNGLGVVQDLTISGLIYDTEDKDGKDFVGSACGKLNAGGTIKHVVNNATIEAPGVYNVGGIVGFAGTSVTLGGSGAYNANPSRDNTFVLQCGNNGDVHGYNKTGGIAGETAATIKYCYNNGWIFVRRNNQRDGYGGIVGYNGNNGTAEEQSIIAYCYNTGTISNDGRADGYEGTATSRYYAGIAGWGLGGYGKNEVYNSYNIGVIPAGYSYASIAAGVEDAGEVAIRDNYSLDSSDIHNSSYNVWETGNRVSETDFKSDGNEVGDILTDLGAYFVADTTGENDGYPILFWQADEPEPTLEGLEIVTEPAKTQYKLGDTFDPAGMVVVATYSNHAVSQITVGGGTYGNEWYDLTGGYTFSREPLEAGTESVTITYTDGGITRTAEQPVDLGEAETFAVYSADDSSLSFYVDLAPEEGTEYDHKTATKVYKDVDDIDAAAADDIPWYDIRTDITDVVIAPSFAEAELISFAYWFCGFSDLTTVTGLENMDISHVTSMASMFEDCTDLVTLSDLSGWNTFGVTDVQGMFKNCESLMTLDLSGWDTRNVEAACSDFAIGCTDLQHVVLGDHTDLFTKGRLVDQQYWYDSPELGATVSDDYLQSAPYPGEYWSYATDKEAFAIYCDDDSSLTFYVDTFIPAVGELYKGKTVTDVYKNFDDTGNSDPPWYDVRESVASVVIDPSFAGTQPKSLARWFLGFSNATFNGLEYIDTSSVTNMRGMFISCSSLTSLDLSEWDTSSVTDMSAMFEYCSSLTSVDVSDWDTSALEDIGYMFHGCIALTSVDVSGWDTSNVTDLDRVFASCTSLTSVDVSGWDTSSVTYMPAVFYDCTSLTSLDVSGWDTSKARSVGLMFYYCTSLETLDLSGWDTTAVRTNSNSYYYFANGCTHLQHVVLGDNTDIFTRGQLVDERVWYDSPTGGTIASENYLQDADYPGEYWRVMSVPEAFAVYSEDDDSLTFYTDLYFPAVDEVYKDKTVTRVYENVDAIEIEPHNQLGIPWHSICEEIASVVIDPSFKVVQPTSLTYWFYGMQNATFSGLENMYTADVTDMSYMFYGCFSLTSEDLAGVSGWDTSNVTDMRYLFDSCISVTSVDVSTWDISSLDRMDGMFRFCRALTTVDISGWDTSSVTDMSSLFNDCSSLTSVDVSSWDTSSATDMSSLFNDCSSLTSVDVSSWDTSSATDMRDMFGYCSCLTSVNVSGWDTSGVTNMSGIFMYCENLETLDLSGWDTSSVTDMQAMFYNCTSLTSVDVSDWDTSSATAMDLMFCDCTSLVSVDVSDWDTANVTVMIGMFLDCDNLETLDLSGWDTTAVTRGDYFANGCTHLQHVVLGEKTDIFTKGQLVDQQYWYDSPANGNLVSKDYLQDAPYPGEYWCLTEAFAIYSADDSSLTFYTDGVVPAEGEPYKEKTATCVYVGLDDTGAGDPPWFDMRDSVTAVVIDPSFAVFQPQSLARWFSGFSNAAFNGLEYMDTSNVTDMSYTFHDCAGLETLDLSGWDTTAVSTYADDYTGFATGCPNLQHVVLGEKTDLFTRGQLVDEKTWYDSPKLGTIVSDDYLQSAPYPGEYWIYTTDTEAFAVYSADDSSLTFYTDSTLPTEGEPYKDKTATYVYEDVDSIIFNHYIDVLWYDIGTDVTSVVIDPSFTEAKPISLAFWFCGMKNAAFSGLEYINTSNVTDMHFMFYNCTSLTSADLSGWDMSSLDDMEYMFYGCSSLASVDMSYSDTHNVISTERMFYNCTSLTSVDLSGLKGKYVESMFYDCSSLTSADLSGLISASSGTSMQDMFRNCTSLLRVDVSGWDTSSIRYMEYMFYNCTSLASVDVSGWDTSNVTDMHYMFDNCSSLTGVNVSGWDTSKVSNMDYMFRNCTSLETLDLSGWDTTKVSSLFCHDFATGCRNLQHVVLGEKTDLFTKRQLVDEEYWYDSPTNGNLASEDYLQDADYPGEYWTYTDKADKAFAVYSEDDGSMTFYTDNTFPEAGESYKGKMATAVYEHVDSIVFNRYGDVLWYDIRTDVTSVVIDASFKEAQPISLAYWFYDLSNATFSGLENMDTSSVASMEWMFYSCYSLTSGDLAGLSGWDTSNLTNMHGIFQNCEALTSADLSGWDTANVTNMHGLFEGCISLTSVDVSDLDTSNITDMQFMFVECLSLTSVDVSDWDTSNVMYMEYMFDFCTALTSLDVSDWDTSSVTNMMYMFYECTSLETLDLSGWDTTKVSSSYYSSDFATGCDSLRHVVLGEKTDIFTRRQNVDQKVWYDSPTNGDVVSNDYLQDAAYPGEYWSYTVEGGFAVYSADDSSLTFYMDDSIPTAGEPYKGKTATDVYTGLRDTGTVAPPWYDVRNDITSVVVDPSFEEILPTSLANWFYGFSNAATFSGLEYLDTSKVTSMYEMFSGCTALTSGDLAGAADWDTSNVTDMSYMFYGCSSLISSDVSDWDTSKVTRLDSMFQGCAGLESLGLTGWDTTAVNTGVNYSRDFATGCESLQNVILGEKTDLFTKGQLVDQQTWYDSPTDGNVVSENYLQDAAYPGEYWSYTEEGVPEVSDVTVTSDLTDNTKTYDGAGVNLTASAKVTPDTAEVSYQWYTVAGDGTETAIDGATFSTYATGSNVSDSGTYKCEVTATDSGKRASASGTITITIEKAAQEISYAENEVTKTIGDEPFTNPLTETKVDTEGGASVTYASSDGSIATVDANGEVTILDTGTVTITATATATDNYEEASASYTVLIVANKDDLEAAITAAGLLDESDYTEASWNAMEGALAAAQAVDADENASQDAVNEATEALETAIKELVPLLGETVDKTGLEGAISSAEGLNEEAFTAESWAAMEEALAAAKEVDADENASQDDVNAARTALVEAIAELEPVTPPEEPVDKTDLENEFTEDMQLDKSDYTEESWEALEEALAQAQEVLTDPDATQEEVEAALEALKTAKDNLEPAAPDKTGLEKEIDEADALNRDDYTADSWAALEEALVNAQAVMDDPDATEEEVEAAVEALKTAMDNLEPAKVKDGLIKDSDGVWRLYKDNVFQRDYNGFAENTNGRWYVERGTVTFKKTDILKDTNGAIGAAGDWYYVIGSKVQDGFTGLSNFKNAYGWWYIKDGKVDFTRNSVDKNVNGWWYVVGGKVQFGFTGLANYKNQNGWWYIEGGKVNFNHNGVEKNQNGWWYVVGSKVQFDFTGLARYRNDHGWWYIEGGKVNFDHTGVEKNQNGWWYVKDSKVQFSYTGIASNANGTWYITDGKVNFGYSGTMTAGGRTYNVRNGRVI